MNFKILAFCLFLVSYKVQATICPSIVLLSQLEVDAFASLNCDSISGSLEVRGSGITNLDSLVGLRYIGGDVYIDSASIQNLKGLDSLKTVLGRFNIRNCILLEDLKILSEMDSLFQLLLYQCHSVDTVSLNTLKYIRSIFIESNNELKVVDIGNAENTSSNLFNQLTIRFNLSLTTVRAFTKATQLSGQTYYSNPQLTTIYPFENLAMSGGALIYNNDNLSEINFYPALVMGSYFGITLNDGLNRISLPKARQFRSFSFSENPNLNECCFINDILVTEGLSFSNNGPNCSELGQLLSFCDTDDPDNDHILTEEDNCPQSYNPGQEDFDLDGIGNECDNCPSTSNQDQLDSNQNGIGNVCESLTSSRIGLHTNEPLAGVHVDSSDLYIGEMNRGLILRNFLNECYRIHIDEKGKIKTTQIECPN